MKLSLHNLVTFINRGVSILIPWFIFLVLPIVYFFSENHAVFTFELVTAVLSAFFALQFFWKKDYVFSSSIAVFFTLSVWIGLLTRSTYCSVDFSTSYPALIKALALVFLYFIIIKAADSKLLVKNIFAAATFTGLIHGFLSIQEYIEAPPIPSTWIDPGLREHVRTRCAGIFTDPNIFGAFLAVIFIFTCGHLLMSETFKDRAIASASLLICGFAELTTLSRGSWIALIAALCCLAFFIFREKSQGSKQSRILLAILVVLTAITMVGPFKYRLYSVVKTKDMTIAQRSLINKGIIKNFTQFPLTGKGLHTFNQIYPGFRVVGGDYPMNAHNEFIQSLLESGHLSAILLMGLFLFTMLKSLGKSSSDSLLPGIFASSLLCLFIHNLSGFSSRILPTSVLICVSSAGAVYFARQKEKKGFVPAPFLKFFYLLIISLALFCAHSSIRFFSINSLMLKGATEIQAGKNDEALATLARIETLDPCNAIVQANKADIYFSTDQLEKARASISKAIELNPAEAIYWLRMARLLRNESFTDAESFFKKAIELDPASELFRIEFAKFLVSHSKTAEAIAQLKQALQFSPGFHQVYTNYLEIESLLSELEKDLPIK